MCQLSAPSAIPSPSTHTLWTRVLPATARVGLPIACDSPLRWPAGSGSALPGSMVTGSGHPGARAPPPEALFLFLALFAAPAAGRSRLDEGDRADRPERAGACGPLGPL